jgi:methyl-accepting chemotaxis protein
LVTNIGSLNDAIESTNKGASSVLSASSELTSTAELLSREVEKFFHDLRVGSESDNKMPSVAAG